MRDWLRAIGRLTGSALARGGALMALTRVHLGLRCLFRSDCSGFRGAFGGYHKLHTPIDHAEEIEPHFLVPEAGLHAFDSCAP